MIAKIIKREAVHRNCPGVGGVAHRGRKYGVVRNAFRPRGQHGRATRAACDRRVPTWTVDFHLQPTTEAFLVFGVVARRVDAIGIYRFEADCTAGGARSGSGRHFNFDGCVVVPPNDVPR